MSDPATIWVVDDDETIRFVLDRALSRRGFRVRQFEAVGEVREALASDTPRAIVTDIRLPDADGLSVLQAMEQQGKELPVIAMTAYSDLDQAVNAFQHGVFDYLPKPFDLDKVIAVVERAVAEGGREAPEPLQPTGERLLGESPAMQEVFRTIGRLSRSDISVLITGETGSGKELVARALHHHSPRSGKPFVAINTAAIPTELLESELFGHERGAFTGAHLRRIGRFEEAAGGTLFLDEIGDMPLALQTRLLRVLAEGEFHRVGGRDLLQADVRVIAATHQELQAKIAQGSFREDLYHRLNVINIALPPLRDRPEDIDLLAETFLARVAAELGLEEKRLSEGAYKLLRAYSWPGNVRQLLNVCRQLCVMAPGEQILAQDLPGEIQDTSARPDQDNWRQALKAWARQALAKGETDLMRRAGPQFEAVLIEAALDQTGGQRQKAARLLGLGRNTLTRKLQQIQNSGADDPEGV